MSKFREEVLKIFSNKLDSNTFVIFEKLMNEIEKQNLRIEELEKRWNSFLLEKIT